MTEEQRYYAKEEDYLEVFLEQDMLKLIRANIMTPTQYNHLNVNTKDLNENEIKFLERELGFNPITVKILSFWS